MHTATQPASSLPLRFREGSGILFTVTKGRRQSSPARRLGRLWAKGATLLLAGALSGFCQTPATPTDSKTIAIVRDGDSWFLEWLVENFQKELTSIVAGKYEVTFKDSFDGAWDQDTTRQVLSDALKDPEVDLIYAAGPFLTRLASELPAESRTKPIFAGAPWFSDATGFPISEAGSSSLDNFGFICSPRRVISDLETLASLAGRSNIHALVDSKLLHDLDEVDDVLQKLEETFGITLTFVTGQSDAATCLAGLPADMDALYVTIMPRMPRDQQRLLYAGIRDKWVPNLSMLGHYGVSLGAMAGLEPNREEALARRSALNVHAMLLGVPTSQLPVYLPVQDRLLIDREVARAIGWAIPYDVWLDAEVINEDRLTSGTTLTLEGAMSTAAARNAAVRIAQENPVIALQDRQLSRSALLPRLSLDAQHQRTDTHHNIQPETPDYVHGGTYGVQLRQLLFDDELISTFRALSRLTVASEYNTESTRLDAMEQAGLSFLNVLSTRALYRIERENFTLTRNNLELARLRHDIGAADPTEIYRWESESATRQAQVVNREVDMRNAVISLNRILGVPRLTAWQPIDIPLQEDDFYFLGHDLGPFVKDSQSFEAFVRFMGEFAVRRSPELLAFDKSLEAQGILLKQRQRAYYTPEIAVQSSYAFLPQGADGIDTDTEEEWVVSVTATLPLFEGLGRPADVRRQAAVVRQLEAQRDQAVEFIEEAALSSGNATGASHPTIRLSRRALQSATRNYDAVLEKYAQGAADILDLLDAQRGLLEQKQQAALAVYQYLADLVSVQRAMSWFVHVQPQAEKDEWLRAVDSYIRADRAGD